MSNGTMNVIQIQKYTFIIMLAKNCVKWILIKIGEALVNN